ncbi:hypothetical protein Pla52n_30670 [Stieleria varia]|uniref:Uncharacterized protein n=1 Tax=Stieleria varia TaxID=2528005 RepID=A0A5C6B0U7_9BACT|nr:hypothetical protein Pla52n_30670 [Stieleria varia]
MLCPGFGLTSPPAFCSKSPASPPSWCSLLKLPHRNTDELPHRRQKTREPNQMGRYLVLQGKTNTNQPLRPTLSKLKS